MTALTLAERIVTLDRALTHLPHAFGGALALAYYAEPRATVDIDLNVFVGVARFGEVAAPLTALGVAADDPAVTALIGRDGQARAWWDRTPVDLFLAYDPFHAAAEAACTRVPFGETDIPILAADHLVVCKVIFDRPKDWVDIDAVLAAGATLHTAEIFRWVGRIAGDEDPRYERIAALLTRC